MNVNAEIRGGGKEKRKKKGYKQKLLFKNCYITTQPKRIIQTANFSTLIHSSTLISPILLTTRKNNINTTKLIFVKIMRMINDSKIES